MTERARPRRPPPTPPPPTRPADLWLMLPGVADNGLSIQANGLPAAARRGEIPVTMRHAKVYIMRTNAIRNGMFEDSRGGNMGTLRLFNWLEFLRDNNIDLAMHMSSASMHDCDDRLELLGEEMEAWKRIIDLGFTFTYLRPQSFVSGGKATPDCKAKFPRNGGLPRRLDGLIRAAEAAKTLVPDLRIVISDTAAAKEGNETGGEQWDYQASYEYLIRGAAAAGHPIHGFHLAWARQQLEGPDWARARRWATGAGVKIGFVPTTDLADESAVAWEAGVLDATDVAVTAGGPPDHLVLGSWKDHPDGTEITPEGTKGTLTHAAAELARRGFVAPRA